MFKKVINSVRTSQTLPFITVLLLLRLSPELSPSFLRAFFSLVVELDVELGHRRALMQTTLVRFTTFNSSSWHFFKWKISFGWVMLLLLAFWYATTATSFSHFIAISLSWWLFVQSPTSKGRKWSTELGSWKGKIGKWNMKEISLQENNTEKILSKKKGERENGERQNKHWKLLTSCICLFAFLLSSSFVSVIAREMGKFEGIQFAIKSAAERRAVCVFSVGLKWNEWIGSIKTRFYVCLREDDDDEWSMCWGWVGEPLEHLHRSDMSELLIPSSFPSSPSHVFSTCRRALRKFLLLEKPRAHAEASTKTDTRIKQIKIYNFIAQAAIKYLQRLLFVSILYGREINFHYLQSNFPLYSCLSCVCTSKSTINQQFHWKLYAVEQLSRVKFVLIK